MAPDCSHRVQPGSTNCRKIAGDPGNQRQEHGRRRDERAELVVDDPTGMRYVEIPTTVEIREDVPANVSLFRAIREKHGRAVPPDDQLAADLIAEDRVLLVFTPSSPQSGWTSMNIR